MFFAQLNYGDAGLVIVAAHGLQNHVEQGLVVGSGLAKVAVGHEVESEVKVGSCGKFHGTVG